MSWVNYALVYLGAALMVFNIIGFVRFARFIKAQKSWNQGDAILYVPIALLVLFLLGYLAVAMFGQPDLIMAGILFGGSIFVFLMYRYLSGITRRIIESERLEAKLMAAEESVKRPCLISMVLQLLLQGKDVKTAMETAAAASAWCIRHEGAAVSIPRRSDLFPGAYYAIR